MKLRDLDYIIAPFQKVAIISRDYDSDNFDDYDVMYSGAWFRRHGVPNCEVIDMYEAIIDCYHAICLEVKDVSDIHEDALSYSFNNN